MTINAEVINGAAINDSIHAVEPPIAGEYVFNLIQSPFNINGLIENSVKTLFSMTSSVDNSIKTLFNINEFNIAQALVRTAFNIEEYKPPVNLPIDVVLTLPGGVSVDIITANISQDEDSWTWNFNITLPSQVSLDSLKPGDGIYPPITLNVNGTIFELMVEGASRGRRDSTSTWSINGRGISAVLDGKTASGVNTEWRNVSALSIVQGLCDDSGVALEWLVVDWLIDEIDGQGRYPIEIINEIVTAIGGVIQTRPDGSLTVRPRFRQDQETPDITITDLDDYITLDEQWIDRDNYNSVSVGNDDVLGDNATLNIESKDYVDENGGIINDNKVIEIYSVPFIDDITLDDSAGSALSLDYQGISERTIDVEAVEIIEGEGSVSEPFYALLSSDYIHDDLGAIEITEGGKITTSIKGQSLINISYKTKYHRYFASKSTNDKYLQVFAEVEE